MKPSCWGKGAAEALPVYNKFHSEQSGCWEKYSGQTQQNGPAAATTWCGVNSATVASSPVKRGCTNPPPCHARAAPLAFPFSTGSSQSYSIDSVPSLLALPNFLLHTCPLSLHLHSRWYLCAAVFPSGLCRGEKAWCWRAPEKAVYRWLCWRMVLLFLFSGSAG